MILQCFRFLVTLPILRQKLNKDLGKSLWANKWKMFFNPDPSKQAQEVIFFREVTKVYQLSTQKHLGIHLDEELAYRHHFNEKIKPVRVLELFVN